MSLPSVHLIERLNNVRKLPGDQGFWESGYWAIAPETAERLVGGNLYLHSHQNKSSHFGGEIISYSIFQGENNSERNGRIVFLIKPTPEHKNFLTNKAGWGNEKKFIW
jgi:hypothetical protein